MEIVNREVILTINLEGCSTNSVSVEKRKTRKKFFPSSVSEDGTQNYGEYEKRFKRERAVISKVSTTAQKRVRLNAEQVNFFISLEARPLRSEHPKEYAFWMRFKPIQRLDFYCKSLAANDSAVSYEFEIV